MNIQEKLLSLGKMARGGEYGRDSNGNRIIVNTYKPWLFDKPLERIILHWIGAYPGQAVTTVWDWWENGDTGLGMRASAHYVVKDENVLLAVPINEVAWHSGDMRNFDSIGIEVIPMNKEGEFSKASIETLRLLIEHIKKEIGKPLLLERHFDGVQKKDCPRFYTPLSEVLTRENQQDNSSITGDKRWENLKIFLNGGIA